MSQKTITIVCVTGVQSYAESSVYAIVRSYIELQKKLPKESLHCLLVSPVKPENCPDFVQHYSCSPFSYLEYNIFMLYSLGQLITTDFALVVQNDGWVWDGDNWRDEFFEYDFIGAPYPSCVLAENGRFVEMKGEDYWYENYQNLPENIIEHQNGGLSLRSKKLLDAPRVLGLNVEIAPPDLFKYQPLKMEWRENVGHFEDLFLTAVKRRELEKHGCKFAPVDVAAYFSVEKAMLHVNLGFPIKKALGTHSSGHITIVGVNRISINHKSVITKLQIEKNPILHKYRDMQYELTFSPEVLEYLEENEKSK